ncbi:hypothetical protein [Victivallis sp. Marseille-Q1083]|uniref:hypothetical protein n=1 Tax=Victivallis sp. Marseille-Q1083 TaxID=2717288 RepID=UPI00158A86C9|nr:hypothetical protein [Victivallis sp. Marseille-Q1083]
MKKNKTANMAGNRGICLDLVICVRPFRSLVHGEWREVESDGLPDSMSGVEMHKKIAGVSGFAVPLQSETGQAMEKRLVNMVTGKSAADR